MLAQTSSRGGADPPQAALLAEKDGLHRQLLTLSRLCIGDLPPRACQGETANTSHGKPQHLFGKPIPIFVNPKIIVWPCLIAT